MELTSVLDYISNVLLLFPFYTISADQFDWTLHLIYIYLYICNSIPNRVCGVGKFGKGNNTFFCREAHTTHINFFATIEQYTSVAVDI